MPISTHPGPAAEDSPAPAGPIPSPPITLTLARCGLPLAMLLVLALAPLLGGYATLVLAIALWKGAGVAL